MNAAEAAVLEIVHAMSHGQSGLSFMMRERKAELNPCVVYRSTGFMSVVTFAEGADWEEVHERMLLDPRVADFTRRARESREAAKAQRERPTRRARYSRRY